ncbi:plasmid segregation centromere-binding protein ParG [Shewanella psychrophila]|uniref:Plasmid segregation centromere-binding protein ParG n=1 Tax=Shewanella psychrophila TaxID=225848 RepID=A0A1S6HTF9_9GAMM|nr:replication protein RepA [Shewanella psychrophila]AQS38728.1 plasmid segregation centromere-binding protein ParG [Shewanella psychrophila]
MSLTDLKRRKKKTPQAQVSIEDFIEDANNYAFGQPSVVSKSRKKLSKIKHKGLDKHSTKIYKHATFSLTEDAIGILDRISADKKIAKSRLIRILIHEFSVKSENEQSAIIEFSDD